MMTEFEEVTSKAMALPPQSRAELAELLIQSLDEKEEDELKSAWLTEIRRRDQEIRSGVSVTKPAEEVLKEAREKLRCI
jgi:putative addiction module component (TIGR02574 family)